jgi:hypothetical protein
MVLLMAPLGTVMVPVTLLEAEEMIVSLFPVPKLAF